MGYILDIKSYIDPLFEERLSYLKSFRLEHRYCLLQTEHHIELLDLDSKSAGLYVDFVGGRLGYRRLHGGGSGQAVAKAVFSKAKERPLVYDATAGLGRDSFVLATLDCKVVMFERNPIVRILLEDGLRRGYEDPEIGTHLQEHLVLSPILSIMDLPDEKCCDVVYLDPMYPEKNSSALVKKDMQIFHGLVGKDLDSDNLLAKALAIAKGRVSVKRPKNAPYLNNQKTNNFIETKSHRFDLYKPL